MYDERCLKIIGANIKLLRTCRGISQGELARALVISQTHLSNIECCRVAVNFRVLLRAANALECTLDDLLQLEFTEPPRTITMPKHLTTPTPPSTFSVDMASINTVMTCSA